MPDAFFKTEGVGFEPTVSFPTLDFESSALNRTQPPFQSLDIVDLNLRMRNFRGRHGFAKAMRRVLAATEIRVSSISLFWVAILGTNERYIEALARAAVDHGESSPRTEKCYNFRLAMPEPKAAYCMSQGQPTLLLVVH